MKKFFSIASIFALTACINAGKEFESPKLPEFAKELFKSDESKKLSAAQPVKDWWNTLSDKELTKLIDKGLEHNNDIRIAKANLEAARANLDGSQFDWLPTITASSNVARQRLSNQGLSGAATDRNVSTYESGFDASWELDLFGSVSQNVAATQARFTSSEAQLRLAYVSVAAEIARSYIEFRGSQNRLEIAKQNAANQQKTLELITALAESGRSNELDLARAKAQLEATSAAVPNFAAEVNSTLNRLAVLTGQPPEALKKQFTATAPLPSIPKTVMVGDAKTLLNRRPDIQVAEANLAAAIADYNLNVADFYPHLSVVGNLGFLATNLSQLGTGSALTTLVAPTLSWAAFDIGRVDARVNAADANSKAALAEFDKTVLQALEEVDSSIVNFAREQESNQNLKRSAAASAKAAELAKQRYESGLDSFLDLLDSENRLLSAQDALAVSEIQTAVKLVAVYKALGGGWEFVVEKATPAKPVLDKSNKKSKKKKGMVPRR